MNGSILPPNFRLEHLTINIIPNRVSPSLCGADIVLQCRVTGSPRIGSLELSAIQASRNLTDIPRYIPVKLIPLSLGGHRTLLYRGGPGSDNDLTDADHVCCMWGAQRWDPLFSYSYDVVKSKNPQNFCELPESFSTPQI